MAHTGTRAGELTEVLIIMLGTLAPTVTNMFRVQADTGPATAVMTGTDVGFTQMLILMTSTVIHTVTAHVEG